MEYKHFVIQRTEEKKGAQIREMTFIYLFSHRGPLRLRSSFQRRAGQESSNKISQALCLLGTSPSSTAFLLSLFTVDRGV